MAPLGQYDAAQLVNLGYHRWAIKLEFGISHPIGRWTIEFAYSTGAITRRGSNFDSLTATWQLVRF